MPKDRREASLATIRSSKSTRVILISFKAGSTGKQSTNIGYSVINRHYIGLNLTSCNNVILVDLWWNPALEVRRAPLNSSCTNVLR